MRRLLLALSVLALSVLALSGLPFAARAAAPTPEVRDALLTVHNRTRAELGLPPLAWDEDLARAADTYARRLVVLKRLEHSPQERRPGQGENLWMGTAGYYSPTDAAQAWADEKSDFRYGVFPDVTLRGSWHGVGHYTQMIWVSTTRVGCAIATGGSWDYLVCRYSPPGNWVGERPY